MPPLACATPGELFKLPGMQTPVRAGALSVLPLLRPHPLGQSFPTGGTQIPLGGWMDGRTDGRIDFSES